jgi:hypothetical protein
VEIPYEDTVLHGCFYRAAGSEGDDRPRPTMVNGFDGPAEKMHHSGGAAGVERGYHVLTTFDGRLAKEPLATSRASSSDPTGRTSSLPCSTRS